MKTQSLQPAPEDGRLGCFCERQVCEPKRATMRTGPRRCFSFTGEDPGPLLPSLISVVNCLPG